MAEQVTSVRTDEDILNDLHELVRSYDPLKMSRPYLHFMVHDGIVKVSGYVKSSRARQLFLMILPDIEGVVAVNEAELYNDDMLRMATATLLPRGTRARVDHGRVTLTGQKPTDIAIEELKNNIGELPGVFSVRTDFID